MSYVVLALTIVAIVTHQVAWFLMDFRESTFDPLKKRGYERGVRWCAFIVFCCFGLALFLGIVKIIES